MLKHIADCKAKEETHQKLLADIGPESACVKYSGLLKKLTDISVSTFESNSNYYKKKFLESRKPVSK